MVTSCETMSRGLVNPPSLVPVIQAVHIKCDLNGYEAEQGCLGVSPHFSSCDSGAYNVDEFLSAYSNFVFTLEAQSSFESTPVNTTSERHADNAELVDDPQPCLELNSTYHL